MNSIENFNQFLNKKYINIKSRILKKQNKLNELKQNGGGKSDMAKIQVDLAYLEQLKEILKRKTDVSDTVDFKLISGHLWITILYKFSTFLISSSHSPY